MANKTLFKSVIGMLMPATDALNEERAPAYALSPGHTTLQMASRYTHAMPQSLRMAVDSLNKRPLPFRPRSAPRSRQLATGTDGN
jgi:hypothetical protein